MAKSLLGLLLGEPLLAEGLGLLLSVSKLLADPLLGLLLGIAELTDALLWLLRKPLLPECLRLLLELLLMLPSHDHFSSCGNKKRELIPLWKGGWTACKTTLLPLSLPEQVPYPGALPGSVWGPEWRPWQILP